MIKERPVGVVLSPVILVALLYFVANIYAFFVLISGGEIAVDSLVRSFDDTVVYLSGVVVFLSLFLLLFFYKVCIRQCSVKSELIFSSGWGWFLLALQCLFLFHNIYFDVNLAGVEDFDSASPLKLFFSAVQPDLLFLIIAVGLQSARLFCFNSIIFSVSMIMRGWIGGFYILVIVYLCKNYPVTIQRKLILSIFLLLVIFTLSSPFLIELKWFLRSGGSIEEAFSSVSERGYAMSLINSLEYILNRFQIIGHTALIAERIVEVVDAYDNNEFIPYWADGPLQWVILKLNGTPIFQLNKYMVNLFFGSENLAYATNPGIGGWILLLQGRSLVFLSYIVLIVFIPGCYILKYAGPKYFLTLFSFVFVYLFHGWFGAYLNLVIYMFGFLILKKTYKRRLT